MENKELQLLEMLSLIYEDMDIDAIEERFVGLVSDIFAFDRVGLFFVKHRKGILQGKLCKGFTPGEISSVQIPVAEKYLFTRPLITGFPLWGDHERDPFTDKLGMQNFAIIPVVSRKRIPCWRIKRCRVVDCPAYGKKWLRCWLVEGTKCSDGSMRCGKDKERLCESCEVFSQLDTTAVEGILLVDNSFSGKPIEESVVTMLSVIAHGVGFAINNAKTYSSVLRDSIHDDLTGLHNRRYFNERLIDEVDRAKRYNNKLSLLFADIDHFKKINDTHGHPLGDAVLVMISRVFQDQLRKTDLVARYGGEEFAIILLNTDKDKAAEISEHLRTAIAGAVLPGNPSIRATISIGVASLGVDANTFDGLLNKADKALYSAKAQGRNRVCTV